MRKLGETAEGSLSYRTLNRRKVPNKRPTLLFKHPLRCDVAPPRLTLYLLSTSKLRSSRISIAESGRVSPRYTFQFLFLEFLFLQFPNPHRNPLKDSKTSNRSLLKQSDLPEHLSPRQFASFPNETSNLDGAAPGHFPPRGLFCRQPPLL